jgi:hypothetical protein
MGAVSRFAMDQIEDRIAEDDGNNAVKDAKDRGAKPAHLPRHVCVQVFREEGPQRDPAGDGRERRDDRDACDALADANPERSARGDIFIVPDAGHVAHEDRDAGKQEDQPGHERERASAGSGLHIARNDAEPDQDQKDRGGDAKAAYEQRVAERGRLFIRCVFLRRVHALLTIQLCVFYSAGRWPLSLGQTSIRASHLGG